MEHEVCKFYVSPEQPECGKPFDSYITTRITSRELGFVPNRSILLVVASGASASD
jgi:hypothetical protein